MAFILLRLLVVGVIAAAADDVYITPPRGVLPCVVPETVRVQRKPPPPLEGDYRPKPKPHRRREEEDLLYKKVPGEGSVEVTRKKNDTEGEYQCLVKRQAGLVLGYPVRWKFASIEKQFSQHPEDSEAYAGQPHVLPCRIASSPPAAISWLKDGEALPKDDRYIFLTNELVFTELRKQDAGVYKCIASNSYLDKTRTSLSGRLQVLDPEDAEPSILEVHDEVNITAARHSQVQLLCLVRGWPKPKITWEFTSFGSRTAILEFTDEVLMLPRMELDMEGVYKCSVDGHDYLFKTYNVALTVPVNITLPPLSREVIRASTVRFNCTADGRPAPVITWYKDGQPLALGGRFNLRATTSGSRYELVVGGATSGDAGVYQCFARSGDSVMSLWATLSVIGANPEAPRGLKCWPLGPKAVLVNWDVPNGTVMAYTVQATPAAGLGQPHPYTNETVIINNPLSTYSFQVRAFFSGTGKNVASDPSDPVFCQGQGLPVRITKQDGVVEVSWKNVAEEIPDVVQWILQYRRENSTAERNITLPGEVHSYNLNVSPSDPLEVRLLGSKTVEWLPQDLSRLPWLSTSRQHDYTGEVQVIPEDLILGQVWSREFSVSWSCKDAERYSYMVCVRKMDGTKSCIESYNTSATVEGLDPETEYEVEVQARLPGSTPGPFGQPLLVTTLSEGPQRFKDLTCKFVNATTIGVSWSAPPAKYTVSYSSELNVAVEQWNSIETVGNSALITGVDPSKNTYVIVTGYDPFVYSPIKTVTAQITDSERFKDLTWKFVNASTVRVGWGAPPGRYRVAYSAELGRPLRQWRAVDTVGNTALITGVDPTRALFVKVTGYDHLIESPIKTIVAQAPEAKHLQWSYAASGVRVRWSGAWPRVVRYSQNITRSVDLWPSITVRGTSVELKDLDPSQATYVMVAAPGPNQRSQVLTIPPRPADIGVSSLYLWLGIPIAVCVLCVLVVAAVCVWRRRKRAGSPLRPRRRAVSENDDEEEEGAELRSVGGRLANGGRAKDAGEPLLNGHVHITENPQSKAPNGKMKKGLMPFDLSRYEDPDATLETVLDADTTASTAYNFLDTSRRPEYDVSRSSCDVSANNSFSKLPDDNMNSELTRSDFHLDNSKIQPTLQPNG